MKRMLINATQSEERRLAVVDGQSLIDYEVEIDGREQRKGNIYKAVITRIEPSLEACFVDYGEERHGFLPFKEVSKEYFQGDTAPSQAKIQDVLVSGQELLVQVEKEERGNKGAALTTFISLAGRYVVLMPNNPRGGGVSRRIEGAERAELKQAMSRLEYPKGMSVIARTAGIGRTTEELQWDLSYLNKLWTAVTSAAENLTGAQLIYQESNLVIRALRDYFNPDIGEILVDTDDIYEQAYGFMSHVMSEKKSCVKRYKDATPLFSRFQIEHQIESAYARTVQLPSGGAIVIDHTEALVSVDVNSARAIRGGDIEETAFKTNVEAAQEIARQARLRDLAGLIVIDFIDMDDTKNRREVETLLRDALRQDRARVQFGSISKFGLLEMSRQRLRPALSEGASIPCPRCGGSGHVRDIESSALQIMRVIQEESMKDGTAGVNVQVPVTVASFLLNEKRGEITKIETRQRVEIQIIPNQNIETPNYRLERLKDDDPRLENGPVSYKLAEEVENRPELERRSKEPTNRQKPVIRGVVPDARKPEPAQPVAETVTVSAASQPAAAADSGGFWPWLKSLFGLGAPTSDPTCTEPASGRSRTAAAAETKDGDESGSTTTTGQRSGQKSGGSRSGGQSKNRSRGGSRSSRGGSNRQSSGKTRQDSRRDRNRQDGSRDDSSDSTVEKQDRSQKSSRSRSSQSASAGDRDGDNRNSDNRRSRSRGDRSKDKARSGDRQNGGAQEQKRDTRRGAADRRTGGGDSAENTGRTERAEHSDSVVSAEQPDGQQSHRKRRGKSSRKTERASDRRSGDTRNEQRDDSSMKAAADSSAGSDTGAVVDGVTATVVAAGTAAAGTVAALSSSTAGAVGESEVTPAVQNVAAESRQRETPQKETAEKQARKKRPTAAEGKPAVADTHAVDASTDGQRTATEPQVVSELEAGAGAGESGDAAQEGAQQPVVTAYTLPVETLQQILRQSGLQWIHSDAERVAAIQAQIAAEPQPVHVPRERPPVPAISDEPLVLVETRKDLEAVRYPFDS